MEQFHHLILESKKEFPQHKIVLNDLKNEALFLKEKSNTNFWRFTIPVWTFLIFKELHSGSLPIFKKYCMFGTPRIVRHLLFSTALIYMCTNTYADNKILKTHQKLNQFLMNERIKSGYRIRLDMPFNQAGSYYNNPDDEFNQLYLKIIF